MDDLDPRFNVIDRFPDLTSCSTLTHRAMSLINRMQKGIKALANEVLKPDSFIKGEEFEDYVRKVLFPKSEYDLVHRTHNYEANHGDYVESSLKPDFQFRDKKNGKEFYVEAKWRAGTYTRGNKIEWCKPFQLIRYKELDKKETKVFIVLGLGDYPKSPNEITLFPVSSCPYAELYDSFIDKFLLDVGESVSSKELWKLDDVAMNTTPKPGKEKKNVAIKSNKGHCIRCDKNIKLDPLAPYCKDCYRLWKRYENDEYEENHCHICGKHEMTSILKPTCYSCYKSNKHKLEFNL